MRNLPRIDKNITGTKFAKMRLISPVCSRVILARQDDFTSGLMLPAKHRAASTSQLLPLRITRTSEPCKTVGTQIIVSARCWSSNWFHHVVSILGDPRFR